jgi:hypothetical protein
LKSTDFPDLPDNIVAMVREWQIGEPLQLEDGLLLPPWRITKQTSAGVELTWTLDLGHESGTRVWLVARVDRLATSWKARSVHLVHARVQSRIPPSH